MFLQNYLEKFTKLKPPHKYPKEVFTEAVKKTTGILINEKEVEISGFNIYIKTKPIYKNEIFLHKEDILKLIKGKLKDKSPKNIL